jgi:hypothetical protein
VHKNLHQRKKFFKTIQNNDLSLGTLYYLPSAILAAFFFWMLFFTDLGRLG